MKQIVIHENEKGSWDVTIIGIDTAEAFKVIQNVLYLEKNVVMPENLFDKHEIKRCH